MTDSERQALIDGFRSISVQLTSGTWEYGFAVEGNLSEYDGFIGMWKTANYNDGKMHWNTREVLRFKLYHPIKRDLDSWRSSLGDVHD